MVSELACLKPEKRQGGISNLHHHVINSTCKEKPGQTPDSDTEESQDGGDREGSCKGSRGVDVHLDLDMPLG